MIGYVTLGTNDPARALPYYDALLADLGAKRLMSLEENDFTMYGTDWSQPSLVITRPADGGAATAGNGSMVGLMVDDRAKVDRLHARALELGAADEGAPGLRGPEKLGYYFAYFRDPDGNKLALFKLGAS